MRTLLLAVAFLLVPIAELALLLKIGSTIGVLPTVGLLIADAALGTLLLRREGRRAWRNLQVALTAHRVPTMEVADGALVVFGGALLLTPGFLTDVLGVACLLPPTRAVLRPVLLRLVGRRVRGSTTPPGSEPSYPRNDGAVVDGEVVDPGE